MTPEAFTQRVRARPYGPREVVWDGAAAWFHGPFAVLTLTDGEAAMTVRADLDTFSLATDLLQLFADVANRAAACLPQPDRLVAEQLIGDEVPVVVRRLAVGPVADGVSVTLSTADSAVHVKLSVRDVDRLATEIRRWASAQ